MRIEYTLSERDLLEAQRAQVGWPGRVLPIFGCLLVLSGIVTLVQGPRQIGPSIGGIIIGLALTFGLRVLASYAYRRDKRLHDRFVAIASDEGVQISSSTGSSKLEWNGFTKQHETKGLFLLFQGPACVNIIPKSCLGAGEADIFRKLVQEKLHLGDRMQSKGLSPKTWIFIAIVSVAFVLMLIVIRNAMRQSPSTPAQTQSVN